MLKIISYQYLNWFEYIKFMNREILPYWVPEIKLDAAKYLKEGGRLSPPRLEELAECPVQCTDYEPG